MMAYLIIGGQQGNNSRHDMVWLSLSHFTYPFELLQITLIGKTYRNSLKLSTQKIQERVTKKHKTFTCNILAVYQVSALFNAQIT